VRALFGSAQNLGKQFLSGLDGLVAAKPGNFQMIILEYINFKSPKSKIAKFWQGL
jgi:hypothetical protein